MQIVIQLSPNSMAHMTNQQVGAFVAYCYTLKGLAWVKVHNVPAGCQPAAEIAFDLPDTATLVDSHKVQSQLSEALKVFADMEPYPCPCGCGAFISVSPCHRQSGELVEHGMTFEEIETARSGNKIGAIKMIRDRTRMGLRDAKDVVDAWYNAQPRPTKINPF